jgi:hypothetical protein
MVVYGEIVGVEEGGVGDGLGIGWDGVGGCLCRLCGVWWRTWYVVLVAVPIPLAIQVNKLARRINKLSYLHF